MAKTTVSNTIVLVDDELHNLVWLSDYLESQKIIVKVASNLNDAITILDKEIYRAFIVDLNIPALPPVDSAVSEMGAVYAKFPGLFAARHARNQGYRGRQVVIYSVHKDPEVAAEAQRLDCTYILKGRPKEIKAEIDNVISFDPTTEGAGS